MMDQSSHVMNLYCFLAIYGESYKILYLLRTNISGLVLRVRRLMGTEHGFFVLMPCLQ
jgi:hypothetical protein